MVHKALEHWSVKLINTPQWFLAVLLAAAIFILLLEVIKANIYGCLIELRHDLHEERLGSEDILEKTLIKFISLQM